MCGPLLFTLYTSPLEDIINARGVNSMIYADDTQLYLTFDPSHRSDNIPRLENCVRDVKAWCTANKLMLNDDKTEIIYLSSRFLKDVPPLSALTIGFSDVHVSKEEKDLGVIIDQHLTLTSHVNKICRVACLALHKIGQIRRYIDKKTTERLVDAFITSRLDSCNSKQFTIRFTKI